MIKDTFRKAYETRDPATFMTLLFPSEWAPIRARILESGVTFSNEMCPWAPRWSPVPPTVRRGGSELATWVKSCIYRAHDLLHQLWGLPVPSADFTEDEFYVYKRAQMCGEVAVLTLAEFAFAKHLLDAFVDVVDADGGLLMSTLMKRNALPMLEGPLRGKTPLQLAARLDTLLHKQLLPKWARDCPNSKAFAEDYVPMLEGDRKAIDHNWGLMKATGWRPTGAPNVRYNPNLDGLELTLWLIEDFYHLLGTDPEVDEPLAAFNRQRRAGIVLPATWNEPK